MLELYLWVAMQIIAESFPISSSTHVKIVEVLFLTGSTLSHIPRYLDDILHFPFLIILAFFFFDRYTIYLRNFSRSWSMIWSMFLKTVVAVGATATFYFSWSAIGLSFFPITLGLMFSMTALASLYFIPNAGNTHYTMVQALVLGAVQGIALLPGISRLALTYVVGRWLGLSARSSLEVSWSMQVPLIIAASIRGVFYLHSHTFALQLLSWPMLFVILGSCFISYGALKITARLAYNKRLWLFAFYLVIPFVILCAAR